MSGATPTYKAIIRRYKSCPPAVQEHFSDLPYLLDDGYDYEIVIAYVFLKVEQAYNRALYGGVAKLHRCDAQFAKRIVNLQHVTREGFKALFRNVFGKALPKATDEKIKDAELVRDKVVHGKKVPAKDQRAAVTEVLDYAEDLNDQIYKLAGFRPFGDMRGFKGRGDSLDKRTSKWVMRGLGFGVKA